MWVYVGGSLTMTRPKQTLGYDQFVQRTMTCAGIECSSKIQHIAFDLVRSFRVGSKKRSSNVLFRYQEFYKVDSYAVQ